MGGVQVYHPNLDLEGNICLNILREDWKPVLSVNSIVYGLQYLFLVSGTTTPLYATACRNTRQMSLSRRPQLFCTVQGDYRHCCGAGMKPPALVEWSCFCGALGNGLPCEWPGGLLCGSC